jgi:hypothetical protein
MGACGAAGAGGLTGTARGSAGTVEATGTIGATGADGATATTAGAGTSAAEWTAATIASGDGRALDPEGTACGALVRTGASALTLLLSGSATARSRADVRKLRTKPSNSACSSLRRRRHSSMACLIRSSSSSAEPSFHGRWSSVAPGIHVVDPLCCLPSSPKTAVACYDR